MKIAEGVYALECTKGSYAYVIISQEIILIDTGFSWTRRRLLQELASMNIKLQDIKHILLTHHDLDHVGNAALLQRLTGAKLWAAKEDIPYIMGHKSRPGIKKLFSFLNRVEKPEKVYAYGENEKISEVEIISTPGHTPGHVVMLYKDMLFVGDLVDTRKGKIRPYPNMNYNAALLMKSFNKIAAFPFKMVCPAHGEPMERGRQWETFF